MTGTIAVIGGGPAGLMAAEVLARNDKAVTLFDQMPSVGRKLLMAGRGGLNLTHSETLSQLLGRYGAAQAWMEPAIAAFPPNALVDWAETMGQPTFVGSSGRVFPRAMKASPLLRAWLGRLQTMGVRVQVRHRWVGWDQDGSLRLATPEGDRRHRPAATILALGGASWPRLGADGRWLDHLPEFVVPFRPANCGFLVDWSSHMRSRFAGSPLKRLAVRFGDRIVHGEAVITDQGLEGGVIYALSAMLRDAIQGEGSALIHIDLRPDVERATLARRLAEPRRGQSLSNVLRKSAGLSAEAIGLVQEALHNGVHHADLASLVKGVPVRLTAPSGIERAISSAGGLRLDRLDENLMLRGRPGVFAAGEMLDWEAPTGGYLLQGCFSTGVAAAQGALRWLRQHGSLEP